MTGLLRSTSEEIVVLVKKKLHRWSTGEDAAGAEEGGVFIAFQSSPCLWKKKLHHWRRRNRSRKRRDEGDGEGVLLGLSVFSSIYALYFYSSLSCSRVCSLCFFTFFMGSFLRVYICVCVCVLFFGFLSRASLVSPSVFFVFLPLPLSPPLSSLLFFYSSFLSFALVLSLLRRDGCCCYG